MKDYSNIAAEAIGEEEVRQKRDKAILKYRRK